MLSFAGNWRKPNDKGHKIPFAIPASIDEVATPDNFKDLFSVFVGNLKHKNGLLS